MAHDAPLVVFDNEAYTDKPKTYRCPHDFLNQSLPNQYDIGLKHLRFSASGQFSEQTLKEILKGKDPNQVWIVDLRLESHLFIDGMPISWYGVRNLTNQGLSKEAVLQDELQKAAKIKKDKNLQVAIIKSKVGGKILDFEMTAQTPHLVETEEQLLKRVGVHYVRLPVLDRNPPSQAVLEAYVQFISQLPDNAWVHLHCRAGKGRASTFAVIYDILKNGKLVSLETILKRQAYFGSKDLTKMPSKPEDLWKLEPAKARLNMIESFYEAKS